ncbi:MAG TPA: 4Fe-4S dicluster domain-containing protein [Alphaproteobacteria bacterium]|nr:4Fe-4S dicluster domain-containing protein [Alphaproteobacteria bacterium]
MPLDAAALARGCRGVDVVRGRQLCRAELERFRALVGSGDAITVGCTQEAPLFREVAGESGDELSFANLRETAGWSVDAAQAGPKMAALAAAAAVAMPDVPFVHFESAGVVLVYGRDERAIEAASLLKEHLDVTVLLARPGDLAPPRTTDFPIVAGTIRAAKGHLGAFEIVVDDYAAALPSSRAALAFGPGRNGAESRCDILLDLSGAPPLFPAADLREGYLRADPRDRAAVLEAVLRARELVGSFDKPRYVDFTADICAHSRSQIVGCRRCLDLCPTSAIAPAGDHVAIDDKICAGCGQCAAACPTGAASYALPPSDALMRKLRTLLTVYREAGGDAPILLVHDEDHGGALIDALARHGDGLPAHVLPLAVNETTQLGLEAIAAAFAYGTAAMRVILRGKPRHDPAGLYRTIALARPILTGLGFSVEALATIETDDPFVLGEALRAIVLGAAASPPASFLATGGKRDMLRFALRELHRVAPAPVDSIALPEGAPFGAVELNVEGCTLCLSCVSACPTGALSDDPERPLLRFAEDACIQCGLCKATCPEKVISLTPRLDFRAAAASARVLKQEEPFPCIRCGKPFGVKSTIERVAAKLEGKHWMYQGSASRLELIKMCEDCRVAVVTEEGFDPYAAAPRPKLRTTDDYLRERERKPKT